MNPARQPGKRPIVSFPVLVLICVAAWIGLEMLAGGRSAVDWGRDMDDALLAARRQNKPVLISFSSRPCVACNQMESDVIPQAEVLAEIRNFVPVKIDGAANPSATNAYNIDALPTYLVLDPEGNPVAKIVGYQPAERFTRFLQTAHEMATRLERNGTGASVDQADGTDE